MLNAILQRLANFDEKLDDDSAFEPNYFPLRDNADSEDDADPVEAVKQLESIIMEKESARKQLVIVIFSFSL